MALLIALRPATSEDAALLLKIYSSTREEELAVTGWSLQQTEAFLRMQFEAQHRYYHEQWPDAAYDIIVTSENESPQSATGFQPVLRDTARSPHRLEACVTLGSRPRIVDKLPLVGVPAGRLYIDRRLDEIHILDIALLPEHRNAGIGTVLLESLIAEATGAGKRVTIFVERNNPARSLYDRLGFRTIEEHDIYLLLAR